MRNKLKKPLSKTFDILGDPKKAAWVIIVLAAALAFALGFDVIQWNTNSSLHQQITQVKIDIKTQNELSSQAAVKACQKSKPLSNHLLTHLADYFGASAANTQSILHFTKKGTPLWRARQESRDNAKAIEHDIRSFLPVTCTTKQKQKSGTKHTGTQ